MCYTNLFSAHFLEWCVGEVLVPFFEWKRWKMFSSKTYRIMTTALLVLTIFHSSVLAQDVKKRRIKRDSRRENSPVSTFRGIEKAWRAADAEALSGFAGKTRVFVNVREIGREGGYYSRSQVYYLFKKMFKTIKLTKFEFTKFHNLDKPDRRVYGIAHRSYKHIRSGRLFQDKVYVTLRREGLKWVISEVKTTR